MTDVEDSEREWPPEDTPDPPSAFPQSSPWASPPAPPPSPGEPVPHPYGGRGIANGVNPIPIPASAMPAPIPVPPRTEARERHTGPIHVPRAREASPWSGGPPPRPAEPRPAEPRPAEPHSAEPSRPTAPAHAADPAAPDPLVPPTWAPRRGSRHAAEPAEIEIEPSSPWAGYDDHDHIERSHAGGPEPHRPAVEVRWSVPAEAAADPVAEVPPVDQRDVSPWAPGELADEMPTRGTGGYATQLPPEPPSPLPRREPGVGRRPGARPGNPDAGAGRRVPLGFTQRIPDADDAAATPDEVIPDRVAAERGVAGEPVTGAGPTADGPGPRVGSAWGDAPPGYRLANPVQVSPFPDTAADPADFRTPVEAAATAGQIPQQRRRVTPEELADLRQKTAADWATEFTDVSPPTAGHSTGTHQATGTHQRPRPSPRARRPAVADDYDPVSGAYAVPTQRGAAAAEGRLAPPPTAEDFTRRRSAPPPSPPASMGVRGALRRGTRGLIRLRPSEREQAVRSEIELVRRNFGGLRQVTVVNPKGGAGKTVAALLLAMTFGQRRGGYVLAWDNNETQGTLGMRAQQDFHARTVRDLLRDMHFFHTAGGRVGDLSQYVRAQGEGMFDVLASDESATAGEMLTSDAFADIRDVVSRFYKLIIVDTGNNVRADNWHAAIDATDQLVVTMSARNDSAETAARMLDHLEASGRRRLARQAVTVVTMPPTRRYVDLPGVTRHFAARTRAVQVAPYEAMIDSGEPLQYTALSTGSRSAWLRIAASVAEGL